jgi:hypothetical protein
MAGGCVQVPQSGTNKGKTVARKTKARRLTVGQLVRPELAIHATADIPARGADERFLLADWYAARCAVRAGMAVSFAVDETEIDAARAVVEAELSVDPYDENSTYGIQTRHDAAAGRLYAWMTMFSPFRSSVREKAIV